MPANAWVVWSKYVGFKLSGKPVVEVNSTILVCSQMVHTSKCRYCIFYFNVRVFYSNVLQDRYTMYMQINSIQMYSILM